MISLIIPTINRKKELKNLLESIYLNSYKEIEVIVVDQNKAGFLDDTIKEYKEKLNLLHLNVDFKGASRARNYGVKFAKGDIINFPDDDSELSVDLLENVIKFFDCNEKIDVIYGRTIDKESNSSSVIKFKEKKSNVNIKNIYKTTVECTMFIKKRIFKDIGGFDETLGVGTYYGAEEGADFILRALYKKIEPVYDPNLIFYHPQKVFNYDERAQKRAYSYGLGFGRLTIKHIYKYKKLYPIIRIAKINIKHSVAIVLSLLKLNKNKAMYYYKGIVGRHKGALQTLKEYC